jgi:hypothetical protein
VRLPSKLPHLTNKKSVYILTFETEIKFALPKNCPILNLTPKPQTPNQVRYLKNCHIERQEARVQFEDDGSQKTVSYKRKVEIEISKIINDYLSFPLLMLKKIIIKKKSDSDARRVGLH